MDISNISNGNTFQAVASFTNNETGGILFSGGMVVFFIIL
jgi:hypothetical protein